MCKKEAVDHLDADDIIEHFKIIYYNMNKVSKAKDYYSKRAIILIYPIENLSKSVIKLLINLNNKGGGRDSARKDSRKNKNSVRIDKLKDSKDKIKILWVERKQLIVKSKCFKFKMLGYISD
ncbi:hypothetical protein DPV78_010819 [Talaromyces pinophilus]|nr:hypothetical protein DPV78_010819 [Talaromyces pinophilus]